MVQEEKMQSKTPLCLLGLCCNTNDNEIVLLCYENTSAEKMKMLEPK